MVYSYDKMETTGVMTIEATKGGKCLLAIKKMADSNHGGAVYGFVTNGGDWRVTNKIEVVSDSMGRRHEERWVNGCRS